MGPRHPMEISSKLPLPLLTLPCLSDGAAPALLRPGALLTAQVVAANTNGTLTLQINNLLLQVASTLQLAAGTRLELQVALREGQLALRLMQPPDEPLMTPQQGLRQTLPRQQPLQPLLEQLTRITTQLQSATGSASPGAALAEIEALPSTIRQAIDSLIKQLPSHRQLATPEGLKRAIASSGMFLERQLLPGGDQRGLQGDLKVLLFRVAALLRQTLETPPPPPHLPTGQVKREVRAEAKARPAQGTTSSASPGKLADGPALLQLLSRLSESALARIQTHQLTTLESQAQGETSTLTLELPLFNGREAEVVELKIRREPQSSEHREGEECWSVTLKLESAEHGTVHAVVSLLGQKASTTFWCEQVETQQLFSQHLEQLRERLSEQGLEPGRTQVLGGMPPSPAGPGRPSNHRRLLDTKA